MKKNFIIGEDYVLVGFPKCVCTYLGKGMGEGTDKNGEKGDTILMTDISDWTLLEKTVSQEELDSIEKVSLTEILSGTGVREFDTGASRNSDEGKLDFEGFLCPRVLQAYAEYMHKNRFLENGQMRDSDNWQKGIPVDAYMKSMYRHFFDTWKRHRGLDTPETQKENLCGMLFNTMGMLHELLKSENNE